MNETLQQVLAELPEIRERADKATKAPWDAHGLGSEGYTIRAGGTGPITKIYESLGFSGHIADVRAGRDWAELRANAEFIAHAREDVPKLCEALQALIEEFDQMKKRPSDAEVSLTYAMADIEKLEQAKQSLQVEIKQLHEVLNRKTAALQVYADDSNWTAEWSWKGINDPTLIAKRELAGGKSS